MKKLTAKGLLIKALFIILTFNAAVLTESHVTLAQTDDSPNVFWEKFRGAVIKGDKAVVAGMSQFPISMPYGMANVRNRAQLIRRYRDIFHHETSAAKCFTTAMPVIDPERPKEFTVGCKNSAGGEVIIYSFAQKKTGWKFRALDNINE